MALELGPGTLIGGRFRLDRLLGKGGMGQVWAATHEVTSRSHALKLLNTPGASAELRARFLREARAASRVVHPNVITIHDAFELDDGTQVMVMDLLTGETLRAVLDRAEVLSATEAADIFLPVVSAVGAAHALGIVHRDLKPENVFLVEGASAAERVKVLDFGIAKLTEHEGGTMTQPGQIMGTPGYMSLEQCTGDRAVDHRADIWAIGAMLYEALTGVRPIDADTLGQMVAKLLGEPIPSLKTAAPDTPDSLATLVDAMLAREPAGRPPDLRAVATELTALASVEVPAFGAAGSGEAEEDRAGSSRQRPPVSRADPEAPTERAAPDTAGAAGSVTAGPASSRRPRGRLGLLLSTTAAVAGLALGALWLGGKRNDATASEPSAAPSASAPPYSEGLEAFLPFPRTNDAALRAYAEAMRVRMADGTLTEPWERVLEHDPNLTGVHARLAGTYYARGQLEKARDHYARALRPGGEATAFERGSLRCLEPLLQRQPSDHQASIDCLAKLAKDMPSSPEARFQYALNLAFRNQRESVVSAVARLEETIPLAPNFAYAIALKAQLELYLGRFDDAEKSLSRALEVAPTSIFAREQRWSLDGARGRCQANLDTARQVIAGNPRLQPGYFFLAEALAALDSPRASIDQALAKAKSVGAGEDGAEYLRRPSVLGHELRLAMLHGDFDGAERGALRLSQRAEVIQEIEPHAWPARWLVQIYLETDRTQKAARVAEGFLEKKDAWEQDPRAEDFALAKDAVPTMWGALRHAGKLSDDELARRRELWLADWRARGSGPLAWNSGYLWLRAYGDLTDDPTRARAALGALRELGPIPPFRPLTLGAAGAGRAYLLAGRVDEAIRWLETATQHCAVLTYPYESTRAHFSLGQARESKGDTQGACSAYQVVLKRWGEAKPASLTATAARARVKALGCSL